MEREGKNSGKDRIRNEEQKRDGGETPPERQAADRCASAGATVRYGQ